MQTLNSASDLELLGLGFRGSPTRNKDLDDKAVFRGNSLHYYTGMTKASTSCLGTAGRGSHEIPVLALLLSQ